MPEASLKTLDRPAAAKDVVFGVTARRSVRSGLLWGFVFGVVVASTALSYSSLYTTQAQRSALAAAFGSNTATIALFGPARALDTVAGFTVFKSFLSLSIIAAVWGLLTSTRLLRGEEDAGRWDLLVAGRTTRTRATALGLAGLGAGAVIFFAATAVVIILTGRSPNVGFNLNGSLFFSVALVAPAVMFLAFGALSSQLLATRRLASVLGASVLGISYALRMVADSSTGLHWLIWVSPLGWVEMLQPLTTNDPTAFIPIAAFTAVSGAAAYFLSGRRDLGASILPDSARAVANLRLLHGHRTLAVRLLRPTLIAWSIAIFVTALLTGFVAKGAASTISGSSVESVFTKLGAPGTGVATYLGVTFLVLSVLISFMAVGQVAALRTEEEEGRAEQLLVLAVARRSWLLGRLIIAAVGITVLAAMATLATWAGAASQGAELDLSALVGAGANLIPPGILFLGIGTAFYGVRPRWTTAAAYGILGWSLLIEVVGGIGAVSHWVLDLSVFHQMAAAPAVPVDWTTALVVTLVGLLMGALGLEAFARRDLVGG